MTSDDTPCQFPPCGEQIAPERLARGARFCSDRCRNRDHRRVWALRQHEEAVASAARFGDPVPEVPAAARPGWVPVAAPRSAPARRVAAGEMPPLPAARVCPTCGFRIPHTHRKDKVFCSVACRKRNWDRYSRGRSGPRTSRAQPSLRVCERCSRARPRSSFAWSAMRSHGDGNKIWACGVCREEWDALNVRRIALRAAGLPMAYADFSN